MKSEHCLIQAFCNRMFIILSLMALGMGVGCMLRRRGRSVDTSRTASATIAVMIFIFGAGVGANRMILDNLGSIGIPAVVIAVSGIVGSLVAACGYDRLFGKNGGGK